MAGISQVELINFRSHESYKIKLRPKTTAITGKNGCGKTSVIEAIYIATVGKSFRSSDGEVVRSGEDFYRVEVGFDDLSRVVVGYDGKRKFFEINDKKYGRLPKEYKRPVVVFTPSDMNIIFASPARRRDFFDGIIAKIVPGYSVTLSRYEKAVRQRNELLKSEYVEPSELFSWNILLAKYGVEIVRRRAEYIQALNSRLDDTYKSIANKEDKVAVMYDGMDDVDESKYVRLLEGGFDRDRMTGWTNYGPHRDSFEFLFREAVAEMQASRGEVRSLVLAMKFIEAELLEAAHSSKPIILLDDVFSELDDERQKRLMSNFLGHQIILTSVEAPSGVSGVVKITTS
jgi:DNA replication and repair protein RecF